MHNMTIDKVAEACNGEIIASEEELLAIRDTEIRGVVTDNRKIEKDFVFIAIVGNRVDGHSFIGQAFKDGAIFVLSERRLEAPQGPYILVQSSPEALKAIAAFYRRQLSIPIIGVVGSVGKTGTKEMIASVLSQRFSVCKTEGNFNNEIGLPLTLLSIRPEHEAAVVEMGISDFGEMHRLGEMAVPDMVVFTNIAPCHLEQLKSLDGVFKAKTEIFEHLAKNAVIILNTDDEKLAAVSEVPGARIIRYGLNGQEICADEVEPVGVSGVRAKLHIGVLESEINIPMPGEHRVYHALAAACAGTVLGLSIEQIAEGIEKTSGLLGRTNFIHLHDQITIIDDCYNASPVSMKAALKLLSEADGIKVAALGDMGELGEDEVKLHREVGKYLATLKIDELYTAGPLAKEIALEAQACGSECRIHSFDTRDALEAAIVCDIKPGSFLLVKASHFMGFSKVVGTLVANFGREEAL